MEKKTAATNVVAGIQRLQQWDMDAVVGPASACQRHVDLKNLTCSNVAKQLKGFRLEHFFCSAPFPHSLLFTPSFSVPNSIAPHKHTHTQTAEHPLSLFGAHEVPHLKYAFLPSGNARREKREPTHVCVCECVWGRCGKCVLTSVTYA